MLIFTPLKVSCIHSRMLESIFCTLHSAYGNHLFVVHAFEAVGRLSSRNVRTGIENADWRFYLKHFPSCERQRTRFIITAEVQRQQISSIQVGLSTNARMKLIFSEMQIFRIPCESHWNSVHKFQFIRCKQKKYQDESSRSEGWEEQQHRSVTRSHISH